MPASGRPMSVRWRRGDVMLPGKLPTPEGLTKHEIVSRLWGGQLVFAMPQMAECTQRDENTKFSPRFKSLLTLLELMGASLHDEKITGATPKAWTDMTASEAGSAAWPGRLPRGGSPGSVLVATALLVAAMVGVGVLTLPGL